MYLREVWLWVGDDSSCWVFDGMCVRASMHLLSYRFLDAQYTIIVTLQLLPQALTDADFGPESIQMGDTGLTLARVGVAHVCARARACPCLCAGDLSFVRA
jgi:hypothetical protein